MLPQQYCLRWKYHHSNLQTMFSQLLDRGSFCDVTLACEGQLIRAHRVVLCACSTFFDTVLSNYANERDPIIIIKDVTFADIRCLIEFMYKGEINVEHAHLPSLLKTADDLKIKGLAEVSWRDDRDDDRPTPPTPATEFYLPTQDSAFPAHHDHHHSNQRSSSPLPPYERRRNERHSPTPPPLDARKLHGNLPTLTPIPTSSSKTSSAAVTATPIEYLGPKRKRGRPPLDDAYDVFNIRKLAQYASHMEHQAYLEAQQHYTDEQQRQQTATAPPPRPLSPSSAAAAYQQHIQQQQNKQRMRHRQKRVSSSDHEQDESLNPGPEWITSNLEVNISEAPPATPEQNPNEIENECKPNNLEEHDDEAESYKNKKTEHKRRERSVDRNSEQNERPISLKRKISQSEHQQQQATAKLTAVAEAAAPTAATISKSPTADNEHSEDEEHNENTEKEESLERATETATVPRTVEEIESVNQALDSQRLMVQQQDNNNSNHTRSRQASPASSTSHKGSGSGSSSGGGGSGGSGSGSIPLPPPLPHPAHFGKFAPEGYMLNEHGMLMTHDSFIHATTANIPVNAGAGSSAAAANGDPEFADIKMEDFDTADLRLTNEELSQWQDVIKMDDYLAKGRRPQFWEEPFTRRVLDAIKNKRLEMKKAARILGVSYGTLYGRYREVYGCLKHPYSNSTGGYRPSSSQLTVQPRFDMLWPPGKRDGSAMLPGPLDIGKLRPKDLTELWARPQL